MHNCLCKIEVLSLPKVSPQYFRMLKWPLRNKKRELSDALFCIDRKNNIVDDRIQDLAGRYFLSNCTVCGQYMQLLDNEA